MGEHKRVTIVRSERDKFKEEISNLLKERNKLSRNTNCNEEETNKYKNKIKTLEDEIENFKLKKEVDHEKQMTMSRLKIQVKQLERVTTEKDIIIDEKEQNLLALK